MTKKQERPKKTCKNGDCKSWAVHGEKYCSACRTSLIAKMKADGYLQTDRPKYASDQIGRHVIPTNIVGYLQADRDDT